METRTQTGTLNTSTCGPSLSRPRLVYLSMVNQTDMRLRSPSMKSWKILMMKSSNCHPYLVERNVIVQRPDPLLEPTKTKTCTTRNQLAIGNVGQCLSENQKRIPEEGRGIGRLSFLRVKVKVLFQRARKGIVSVHRRRGGRRELRLTKSGWMPPWRMLEYLRILSVAVAKSVKSGKKALFATRSVTKEKDYALPWSGRRAINTTCPRTLNIRIALRLSKSMLKHG